jgi:hypothetical protein
MPEPSPQTPDPPPNPEPPANLPEPPPFNPEPPPEPDPPPKPPAVVNMATVTVGSAPPPPTDDFDPAKEKATGAREVARVLVFTFAGTVAATFLTIAFIYGLSGSAAQARDFVAAFTSVIPVMENFVTKIFGPLLAFVLGYYFGQVKSTSES